MIRIPLKIESIQNVSSNWRAKARRVKGERLCVDTCLRLMRVELPTLPCVVVLTRVAPRPLDSHDNLRVGFKPTVDAIAAWIGIKDNDPRVTWEYAQARGTPHEYAVRLEFQPDLFPHDAHQGAPT